MGKETLFDETHPENSCVIEYLKLHSFKRPRWSSGYYISAYHMQARDDLEDWLYEQSKNLPVRCESSAFGYPLLVNPNGGVIFALATGTHTVGIRLPPETRRDALISGAQEAIDYHTLGLSQATLYATEFGVDWVLVLAGAILGPLVAEWLRRAYEYAQRIG